MPPPPPPRLPPPPDAPPEPKPFKPAKGSSSTDKNDVFKEINKGGFKLKKTVTVDKSGPYIPGKPNSNNNNNNNLNKGFSNRSPPVNAPSSHQSSAPNGVINFGDLFAGGIPTLKPTGLRSTGRISPGGGQSIESNNKSKETINNLLRKQVAARGPPPQPPSTNSPFPSTSRNVVNDDKPVNRLNSNHKITSDLGHIQHTSGASRSTDSIDSTVKSRSAITIVPNNSSLHSNNSNSSNLHENNNSVIQRTKLISHGKPNLAPKPPGVKPSPPPKNNVNGRLLVNRTQSMRMSRSPPVTPTSPFSSPFNGNELFNTLRNASTLHQSHEALNRRNPVTPTRNATLPINQHIGRPTQPPPSRPPQTKPPPPPRTGSNTSIIPPQSPPPPPPSISSLSRVAPPPPIHNRVAPPPPPPPIHARSVPFNSGPPEPPQRGSSMRNGMQVTASSATQEFDSRYFFHSVSEFPLPDVFKRIQKQYSGTGSSKQHAPLPPNTQLQLGKKLWSGGDSSSC